MIDTWVYIAERVDDISRQNYVGLEDLIKF